MFGRFVGDHGQPIHDPTGLVRTRKANIHHGCTLFSDGLETVTSRAGMRRVGPRWMGCVADYEGMSRVSLDVKLVKSSASADDPNAFKRSSLWLFNTYRQAHEGSAGPPALFSSTRVDRGGPWGAMSIAPGVPLFLLRH